MIRQVSNKRGFSSYLKTKIVATVGPSSSDEKTLLRMIKNGMAVARLNFSHGSYEDHAEVIRRIRKISEGEDLPVALLQDLSGPKIRLSQMAAPVLLKRSQVIKLGVNPDCDADLYTGFKDLPGLVRPKDTILLDDGNIELTVVGSAADHITCKVKVPGLAKSRKGINLPDISVSIPVFTEKDKKDLTFGIEQGVNLVALSFVESAGDVVPVRAMMKDTLPIPVIAKIERPVALKNIERIVDAFDGIMVARGDLGVEVPPEEVPVIQKKLIRLANQKNKLVITATQMLESMMNNPRPTRAEASDVSNAIMDGSDAVMLSGETAAGKYPVQAVNMMKRIALTTENSRLYKYSLERKKEKYSPKLAIVESAADIAEQLKAKYIMVFSLTGSTARLLSKYRPPCPILAFTPNLETRAQMAAYWGVTPFYKEFIPDTDEMMRKGEELIKSKKLAKSGDLVVTVAGVTTMTGASNMLRISRIE